MKNALFVSLTLVASQLSFGKELNCYLTKMKNANVPFLTAQIGTKNKLKNVRFNYKKMLSNHGITVEDFPGVVTGELITSNHSPYKGNVRYGIKNSGGLILPADLSNDNLEEIEEGGVGWYKGENGVFITSFADVDGAGNHVSYRLSCQSDL